MSDDHKHDHGACCAGHTHEAAKEARVLNPDVKASSQTTLRVAGMDCPDEIAAIERALKPLAGVGEVKVNLMASPVLPYGTSARTGKFRCSSAATGVRCLSIQTGHGFDLSRESFATF